MRRRQGPGARRRAIVAALIAIAATAFAAYLVFTKDIPFTRGFQIDAMVANTSQLRAGSPVRIAGVDVGKVEGILNGPGDTQIVRMTINENGQPIHKDARMKIRPRLFLEGGFYADLRPGSASGPVLEDRGTIPLSQTSVPVQIHQVLNIFNRPTRTSLRVVIDELSRSLDNGGAEGLNRVNRPLGPALRDTARVLNASRGSEVGDLPALIRNNARVVTALAQSERELASSITNLNRTTGALANQQAALSQGIDEFDRLLVAAPPALDSLDRTLPTVDRFVRELRPALRAAPPVLRSAGDLLEETRLLVRPNELPLLIAGLTPALNELPTLTSRLRRLFPLVTPVSECVRDRVVPVLNAKLDDGPRSTDRPVWQNLVHAAVGLAGASGSYDANGHWVRYLAGLGTNAFTAGDTVNTGQLVGQSENPILGSRPQPPPVGTQPPFKSDEECRRQAPVNLTAKTGPAPSQRRIKREPVTIGGKKPTVKRLVSRIKRIEKAQGK